MWRLYSGIFGSGSESTEGRSMRLRQRVRRRELETREAACGQKSESVDCIRYSRHNVLILNECRFRLVIVKTRAPTGTK